MKIRVWGTSEECAQARAFYKELASSDKNVKSCSISRPYLNRDSVNQYRVYINIEYYDSVTPDRKKLQSP